MDLMGGNPLHPGRSASLVQQVLRFPNCFQHSGIHRQGREAANEFTCVAVRHNSLFCIPIMPKGKFEIIQEECLTNMLHLKILSA
jgi:hypothetical protein